jgi:hypothetical protein
MGMRCDRVPTPWLDEVAKREFSPGYFQEEYLKKHARNFTRSSMGIAH